MHYLTCSWALVFSGQGQDFMAHVSTPVYLYRGLWKVKPRQGGLLLHPQLVHQVSNVLATNERSMFGIERGNLVAGKTHTP